MHIATSPYMSIIIDTMNKYVAGLTTLETNMHMLSDELDRGAQAVYQNTMEARVRFQKDVTLQYMDTITDYRAWHRFAIVNHHEDLKELALQEFSEL